MTVQRGYAKSGGAHLAYSVSGDGPLNLLHLSNATMGIDALGEESHAAQYYRRLASFGRVVLFDQRGVGRSDPIDVSKEWTVESMANDARAVADAVGLDTTVVIAEGGGGPVGITFAAKWPERVRALVLINESACAVGGPDNPHGHPPKLIESFLRENTDPDDTWTIDSSDDVVLFAPSLSNDPSFREWWVEGARRGASPEMARIVVGTGVLSDVRPLLADVIAPTLVLHRTADLITPIGLGRDLADGIAGARFVELPGGDHFAWSGDSNLLVDEIEDFLVGRRGGGERVLASVMFTDIVDSTVRAAALGDRAWRAALDAHDAMVRAELKRYGGREVNTTGDGFVGAFESPTQAVRCASAIVDAARAQGLEIRAGVHTGECERRGNDLAGLAVHIAARISAQADPSEVLVSRTLRDLVGGSDLVFVSRGEHVLKGVPEAWQLYAVEG